MASFQSSFLKDNRLKIFTKKLHHRLHSEGICRLHFTLGAFSRNNGSMACAKPSWTKPLLENSTGGVFLFRGG